jgi:coatomer protein complex subunit gamma
MCSGQCGTAGLESATDACSSFSGSFKPTVRFAAIRTLAAVANQHPSRFQVQRVEALIGDSNRSIATLAITTLLKRAANSIERLLKKQISAFHGNCRRV